jgi:hypothetical protein
MKRNRELVAVVTLASAFACERARAVVEPTTSEPAVIVELPVADEPSEPGTVEAKIGFRQGDQCSLEPVGFEFPLVATDSSEVVLMGRYDTYFGEGMDFLLQGLWHIGPGKFSMFGNYMEDEAIQLIDWLGVDVSTCDEAERLAASAVAEANAYLASKRWFPMTEVEDFEYNTYRSSLPPGPEDHYSCVPGTQLNLCASVAGFTGELRNSDWISNLDTWLYVSLRACVAVAVQYEQSEGPWERTAIEVFDISGIVAALPSEYVVECGAG